MCINVAVLLPAGLHRSSLKRQHLFFKEHMSTFLNFTGDTKNLLSYHIFETVNSTCVYSTVESAQVYIFSQ